MQNYQKYSIYTMIMPFDTIKLEKNQNERRTKNEKFIKTKKEE